MTELIVHLGPVLGAPDVGGAEPEHLAGRVVEAGQRQLGGLPGRPGVVGAVRLLDPAVVRYVLPLQQLVRLYIFPHMYTKVHVYFLNDCVLGRFPCQIIVNSC